MAIEYPIEVHGIDCKDSDALKPYNLGTKCGDFVSIKPCGDEYEGKTYLGIFLGSLALQIFVSHKPKTKKLEVEMGMHNPAIFVPDLNDIIMGIESWWGKIEDEKSLREISNSDIDNIWYVKALRKITEDQTTASRKEEVSS